MGSSLNIDADTLLSKAHKLLQKRKKAIDELVDALTNLQCYWFTVKELFFLREQPLGMSPYGAYEYDYVEAQFYTVERFVRLMKIAVVLVEEKPELKPVFDKYQPLYLESVL